MTITLLGLAVVLSGVGCQGATAPVATTPDAGAPPPAQPAGSSSDRPTALEPERPVVFFGDQRISAAELRDAFALATFLSLRRTGNLLPAQDRARPEFRRQLVQDLVDRRLIRAEAARLGLTPASGELAAALNQDPGDGSRAWHQVTEDRLLGRALVRFLIGPLDEAELRRAFIAEEEKIEVRVVRIPRTPTSAEVDRFLREQPAQVERYFQEHRSSFRQPARRRVRLFRHDAPPQASSTQQRELERQVHGWWSEVLEGKLTVRELVRSHSTDPSRDQEGLLEPVVREQLPAAFSVPIGQVSRVYHDHKGFFFVEVLSEEPAADRELTEGLRREVAARAVVAARENRHAWELATRVREGLAGRQPLAPILTPAGLNIMNTGLFPRGHGDFIPTVGLVPQELITRLFATRLPPGKSGLSAAEPEPITEVGADLLVVQFLRRRDPDWQRFEREKATLPERIVDQRSRHLLTDWLVRQPDRQQFRVDEAVLMQIPFPTLTK